MHYAQLGHDLHATECVLLYYCNIGNREHSCSLPLNLQTISQQTEYKIRPYQGLFIK